MLQGQLRAVLGYLHRAIGADGGLSDPQLLDRWRNERDPAAFEVLIWRHGTLIWNVCRRILHREQDIEDAFQATCLTFLRKADTIGQGQFLGSWLYKVAYRTALTARETSAKHAQHQELLANCLETASEQDDWDELRAVFDEELNRLPEKYRSAIVLCYLEGKTTDEAAHDLGCPRGTVGTRLAWARQRLRSRLARRGVAFSAILPLLTQQASATVPAFLVAGSVKAATYSTTGKALAAGAISTRAAALNQGVLQAMFVTKLKMIALMLLMLGILGSGAGLLAPQAFAESNENIQTISPVDAEGGNLFAGEEDRPAPKKDKPAPGKDKAPPKDRPAPVKGEKESPRYSGSIASAEKDGKSFSLALPSKSGEAQKVEIKLSEKTLLSFSHVGPNEAKLAEGLHAEVWLEKDSKDVAARVVLHGKRYASGSLLNEKTTPQPRTGKVAALAGDGKGITLEQPGKGEHPGEKSEIHFTDKTRIYFTNVTRGGAKPTAGYGARVWLDDNSKDTAKVIAFIGHAETRPVEGKGEKTGKGSGFDRSGKVVGVSGQTLTVEVSPRQKGAAPKIEIKLTDSTKESYQYVLADGARPTAGYEVHVWLAKGSEDRAARVEFTRPDPRKHFEGRITATAADGSRCTVKLFPDKGDGEGKEIKITPKTNLVFLNVPAGGAKLTEGYRVHGWLVEGSEDTAEELVLTVPEKTSDKPSSPPKKKPD